uniref:Uncharacterized protein n=1 Tax=Cyprinodon variegatus TaxID=28743 RepID=A0A3Q2CLG4_CYPVA
MSFILTSTSLEHLAPLSAYSRMVMCDQIRGPQSQKESADPFVNFKVELINDNWGKKRPIDCDVDDDFSSPCKKQCIPNVVSPDLGCVMDYSSSLTRNNSMSPFVPPFPKPNQKTETDRSEMKETVSSRLELECVERGCTKKKAKTENILINSSSDFDQDVEDILCLNLLKEEEVQGPADEEKPATRAVEDDKVSSFHLHEKEECKTEGPPQQQGNDEAPALCQHFSFLTKDSRENMSGSLLAPLKLDFLEGYDEDSNIGQPMFESSICQLAATESEAERSEAPRETYNSEDCTGDSLNETTLPINVQVGYLSCF